MIELKVDVESLTMMIRCVAIQMYIFEKKYKNCTKKLELDYDYCILKGILYYLKDKLFNYCEE